MVMSPKFGYSSISMRFYRDLTRKTNFFKGCSWFKFNKLGLAPRYGFENLSKCCKRIESKSQNVLGANYYVSRI